jgi:ribosome-associated toxin RatA of RatAB toxin-antitoxin module
MRKVNRSALVPYSAEDMFALVADVEAYPSFLPWCSDVEVHYRRDNIVESERMQLALVGGPFRHLSGGWEFQQLGQSGSKVALRLDFEFDSRMLDMMIGAYFEDICNELVTAFTQRATQVFGLDA